MVFSWLLIVLIAVNFKNIWLGLFLVWTVTNMILNYNGLAVSAMILITVFLIAYDYLLKIIPKKSISFWLNCICISALGQIVLCVFQAYNKDPFFQQSRALCGFLDNPVFLSIYLVCCLPAFFRKYWRCFLILILPPVFYNDNKIVILSLGLMVVFYLMYKIKRTTVKAAIAACLIISSFSYVLFIDKDVREAGYKPGSWRAIKWQSSRRAVYWPRIALMTLDSKRHSLFGCGPGQFKRVYNEKYFKTPPSNGKLLLLQAENEPLQLWNEFGYLGVLIISGFATGSWFKFRRYKQILLLPACGIVAEVINSFGSFPFHIPPIMFLVLFYAAIIESY